MSLDTMATTAELAVEQLSLSAAFSKAYKLHAKSPLSHSDYQELLSLLEHCDRLVEQGALFSHNEDQEDLSTGSMRYLLIPFLTADVLNTMPQQSMAQRLQQAQAAKAAYSQFLQRCSQYCLLGPTCQATYDAQESGQALDAGTARAQKVERFKRSKAIQGLIQQLESRQKQADEEVSVDASCAGLHNKTQSSSHMCAPPLPHTHMVDGNNCKWPPAVADIPSAAAWPK
jgi:immunoglobulin-binding protein 1